MSADIIEGDNLKAILQTGESTEVAFDLHKASPVVLVRYEVLLLRCNSMASDVDKKECRFVFVDVFFHHAVVDCF